MNFAEKVILITGACSDFGMALARYLSQHGASLALTERNVERLEMIGVECDGPDIPEPLCLVADISKEIDQVWVINETISHFGKLDVLINNAEVVEVGNLETATLEQFDRIMNTNVRALVNLTQLAVPHLEKTKGNVLNVSNAVTTMWQTGVVNYCMSKAAVDQFTRVAALELAVKHIRVNAVNPGAFVSEASMEADVDRVAHKEFLNHCEKYQGQKKGVVKDAIKTACFLIRCVKICLVVYFHIWFVMITTTI
jgi:NAD(P)-dependent dehydrogenase (short-subunit alcohol dehydrogenase family)